jgi:ribosomal protein S27E
MICPKCKETVSFLDNEETKTCKKCGEVIFNTEAIKSIPKKIKKTK